MIVKEVLTGTRGTRLTRSIFLIIGGVPAGLTVNIVTYRRINIVLSLSFSRKNNEKKIMELEIDKKSFTTQR